MPTINFDQPVRYFPGNQPAKDIDVTIFDVDQGGNGDDVIYQGSTSNTGQLSGTSSNWMDTNNTRVYVPWMGWQTQPLPDVPIFMIQLKEGNKDTGRIPFVPGVPIILPWADPEPDPDPFLKLDGNVYDEPSEFDDFVAAVIEKFRSGDRSITFEVRAPESIGLDALAKGQRQAAKFVERHTPAKIARMIKTLQNGRQGIAFATAAGGMDWMLAIALFAGASLLTLANAIAIVWLIATLLGYESSVELTPPTGSIPFPGLKVSFKKPSAQ